MAKYLTITIENLRGIKKLNIQLNMSPGIYAITGQNASGKSTLMAAIASIFFRELPKKFFVPIEEDAKILIELNDKSLIISPKTRTWWDYNSDGELKINGFYEGSIIYGNRFRDTNLRALFEAQKITRDELDSATEFVWKNLGKILYNNKNYYKDKLFRLVREKAYSKYKFREQSHLFKSVKYPLYIIWC